MESTGIFLTGETGVAESGGKGGITGLVESCEKESSENMIDKQIVKKQTREIFIPMKETWSSRSVPNSIAKRMLTAPVLKGLNSEKN